ncbi:glutathione S-transferase family protein [Planktotalea sp.]|uniref:glutathione S-transferase family protein n=1 Tax=Planktotalea sp. TaxID=2029877 RepID=UPI003D6B57BF
MYEVFGTLSTRAFRVIWALEELGEPYELIQTKPQDPELKAFYPAGKVPAMKVDGNIITDSVAIMTYLADSHGKLIAPAGTIERAKQDAITHAINDEIDAVLWAGARHSFVLPADQRVPEVKLSLKWEFNRNVNRLADRITTPFVAGESFSITDILLTQCLNWAISAKFDYDNEKMKDYAKRMRAREAFKRVRALA